MNIYRATVWYLSAVAGAVEGYAGLTRRVITMPAESASVFMAEVRDQMMRHPDDEVWFGPISERRYVGIYATGPREE